MKLMHFNDVKSYVLSPFFLLQYSMTDILCIIYNFISIRENFQNNHGIYLCNSSKLCSIILKKAKKLKEKARR